MKICLFLCLQLSWACAQMHHHLVDKVHDDSYEWIVNSIDPFEELLISWNSNRPQQGHYTIYVSVDTGEWSPWLTYAEWGKNYQKGFISTPEHVPVKVYQDAVAIAPEYQGLGFKIKVVAEGGASLSGLNSLHVCSSNPSLIINHDAYYSRSSTCLKVEGLSQMALNDSRNGRLCSPTSTTAVVRYFNGDRLLDPIDFAESCYDSGFDIFGNWVFNAAEAYNRLVNYHVWVERYTDFSEILDSLDRGVPTVISVRGPLSNSASAYKNGHLMVVIGFDENTQEVICMDPAFLSDEETIVRYPLNELLQASGRRKNIAYVFKKA